MKLGVSGLIQAYRTAASDALDNAEIKVVAVTQEFTVSYAYEATSEIMRLIDDMDATILDQVFKENCRITFAVNVGLAENVGERIELLKNLGHEVEKG